MTYPNTAPGSLQRRQFMAMALLCAAGPAAPQFTAPAGATLPALQGATADGKRLQLAAFQGRVVLVFYWATGCPVCRDKMKELRANLMGWRSQPFTLIGVNMDAQQQDWLDYERLVAQTTPASQRFASVWAGGSEFSDTMGRPLQLPSARLIDKRGQLIEAYQGRIPVEAWDRIADVL